MKIFLFIFFPFSTHIKISELNIITMSIVRKRCSLVEKKERISLIHIANLSVDWRHTAFLLWNDEKRGLVANAQHTKRCTSRQCGETDVLAPATIQTVLLLLFRFSTTQRAKSLSSFCERI